MAYEIAKRFGFSAAHRLSGLDSGHKCWMLHGHNYEVEMVLREESVDERGFVVDYGELGVVKDWLDEYLDHGVLVSTGDAALWEFCDGEQQKCWVFTDATTAENIAFTLYSIFLPGLPSLVAVRVSETGKTWAEYRGG